MLTDKAMGLATPIILDEGISKAFEVILAEFPESEEVKTGTEATIFCISPPASLSLSLCLYRG